MRRRVGSLFIICAAIPIAVFASTAWACGALTTAKVDNAAPAPNQVINVTGRNFATNTSTSGGCPCTGVDIRLDSRSGQVLANVPTGGNFTVPVRVPASTPVGWHILVLTQSTIATGVPKSGTPARATIRVQGAPVAGSSAPWGAVPTGGGPGSPDLPLPGILLSVALLATGLILVARDKGKKKATRAVTGA